MSVHQEDKEQLGVDSFLLTEGSRDRIGTAGLAVQSLHLLSHS